MMSSRFSHVAASLILHSFLLPNNHHCIKVFFIHSSADGHLGCFYFLTIMNGAAVNTPVRGISCGQMFSFHLGICPGVELLGQMILLHLTSEELPDWFLGQPRHSTFTPAVREGPDFSIAFFIQKKETSPRLLPAWYG